MSDPLENQVADMSLNAKFNLGAAEFVPSWEAPADDQIPQQQQSDSPAVAETCAENEPKKTVKNIDSKDKLKTAEKNERAVSSMAADLQQQQSAVTVDEEDTFDVTELGKEHLNIIFIGHVDAGKSTMGGHILYLTGMVDKRTMEKYEREAKELGRESWYLSWALDLNTEERAKGKTTEYGRGYFETEKRKFTIIDAPGHKNFVPSMIEGAAQADVGVLVISARKGEFEAGFEKGGQTREHAMLAKTAGVKHLIMVINKMDDPSVNWSQERYDECVAKILPFLKGVGYDPKRDLDIMPVSGFTGANIRDALTSAACPWYSGPSLLQKLDTLELGRSYTGPLLMPVADKFKEMGTVVLGKIESGRVKKGQSVMIMPNKKVSEVLAIFMEDTEIPMAKCGDNVRIRLKNVEEEDLSPGFVICGFKNPVHCVTKFEAQLKIIEYKSIMCAGYTAVMHAHTMSEEVQLAELLHMIDKKTGRKSKHAPKFVRQGDACIVRIECNELVCMETYADYQQLGRFTLRDEGKTVAIGKVTKLILE